MLITILAIVVALVAWSLHLMQESHDRREFSLMLAGTLVAFSAAALVGVYFLMGNCIGYLTKSPHYPAYQLSSSEMWVELPQTLESEPSFTVKTLELD